MFTRILSSLAAFSGAQTNESDRISSIGSKNAARREFVLLAAFLLIVSLLILLTGPLPQSAFATDVAIFLDACQRQWLGQRIHHDFFSPLGGLAFLPFSFAMRFTGLTVDALPLGVVFWFVLITVWSSAITRNRLSLAAAAVFVLVVGLLAAAAYPLDFGGWKVASYAMYYNRMCWGLFAVLCLETFVPVRRADISHTRRGALSSGAALAALAFIKVNFFLVAGLCLLAGMVVNRDFRLRRIANLALGFVVFGAILVVTGGIDLLGYLAELRGLSSAQPPGFYGPVAVRIFYDNRWSLLILIVAWLALMSVRSGPDNAKRPSESGLVLLIVAGAGLVISLANCQFAQLPTFPLALLLASAHLSVSSLVRDQRWPAVLRLVALAGCCLYSLPHAAFLQRAAAFKRFSGHHGTPELRINTPSLQDLLLRGWPSDPEGPQAAEAMQHDEVVSPYVFGQWLNDGIALLHPHLKGNLDQVLSLDWSNPFPFALGLPPPFGDHIAWHVGRVISGDHHPDVDGLLNEADFVMEPRLGAQLASIEFKRALFGPRLSTDFRIVGKSRFWTLWEKVRVTAPSF